ncbi:MAG: 6-phosphofructokinase [Anaerolineales bacterium]|nr:6-phosphofructokinase [Anaerolineales bacterium]
MAKADKRKLGVLTSGGDSPGMNAAIRAVVRTALDRGLEVFAITEGYQGMVDGGNAIKPMAWDSVGGILQRGGTVIGTARCADFRTREGRLKAAFNLAAYGIDALVVIGGDGSLTGADIFRREWPSLLEELVQGGKIGKETAKRHPYLTVTGLVGSIDNDFYGTDMTIGADTALHRIVEAVDAISSTATSHQRTFVVEVMGRHCGYLALMSALACGADWVLIPESPPDVDNWEDKMCAVLAAGRAAGRRDTTVIVAEGATDRDGKPITSAYVKQVLEEKLGEDCRVTILGHVQRGGSPSAFDRNLGTLMGHAAVEQIERSTADSQPMVVGWRENRVACTPLMECVEKTQKVSQVVAAKDYEQAMALRGDSFKDTFRTLRTMVRSLPHAPKPGLRKLRIAVLNSGAPAPGMNTAVRSAVRLGLDKGHTLLGVRGGLQGLINGDIQEMNWMSVNGWAPRGGSELGTGRKVPAGKELYAIARNIEELDIHGLLIIGGWSGYEAAHRLWKERENFPAYNIPLLCMPATINNNLPGSELSIGADTSLNNIVESVDKVKQSSGSLHRCFVVEVMGRYCGYLALMSGMATGAERVYLHEEGVTLQDLEQDLENLKAGFEGGKRISLMIRNENANPLYTTAFMYALFEEEGHELFDVRQAILGHLQQGGNPSPFDRIQATRLAARCIEHLTDLPESDSPPAMFIGMQRGKTQFYNLEDLPRMVDLPLSRPKEQWWMDMRGVAKVLSKPGPKKE